MSSNSGVGRDTSFPVTARLTSATVNEIDALAAELKLARGAVVALLVSAALKDQDTLLRTFKTLHGQARSREGVVRR